VVALAGMSMWARMSRRAWVMLPLVRPAGPRLSRRGRMSRSLTFVGGPHGGVAVSRSRFVRAEVVRCIGPGRRGRSERADSRRGARFGSRHSPGSHRHRIRKLTERVVHVSGIGASHQSMTGTAAGHPGRTRSAVTTAASAASPTLTQQLGTPGSRQPPLDTAIGDEPAT